MVNIVGIEIGIATGILVSFTIFNDALIWIVANLLVVLAFAIAVVTSKKFSLLRVKPRTQFRFHSDKLETHCLHLLQP